MPAMALDLLDPPRKIFNLLSKHKSIIISFPLVFSPVIFDDVDIVSVTSKAQNKNKKSLVSDKRYKKEKKNDAAHFNVCSV